MKRAVLSISMSCVMAFNSVAVDAFIHDGQSNDVGQGDNEQIYSGNMSDLMLDRDNNVYALTDPAGSNFRSIYSVYTGPATGSLWPSCANTLDAQIKIQTAYVACSVDGISILNCMPAGPDPEDRTNTATYYGLLVLRTRIAESEGWSVKCRIVTQEETDGFNGMSQADITSNIWYQADQYYADTGRDSMWNTIYGGAIADPVKQANVVNGIKAAWNSHHVRPGADFTVIDVSASRPHAVTDQQLTLAGQLVAAAIIQNFYSAPKHLRFHR